MAAACAWLISTELDRPIATTGGSTASVLAWGTGTPDRACCTREEGHQDGLKAPMTVTCCNKRVTRVRCAVVYEE